MAVKPEKIKERLKALWPKANLSTKRLDAIAAKLATKPADDADDTAVDAVLNDANDFMSFEDIAKEDDRVRTLEANQKKPDEKKEDEKKEDEKKDDDNLSPTDKLLKTLTETIGGLKSDIESIKSGKVTETKRQLAQKQFEADEVLSGIKPEIKEKWLNRIVVKDDTTDEEIAAQIAELKSEYGDLTQHLADQTSYAGIPPAGGKNDAGKMTDEEAAKIVDSIL